MTQINTVQSLNKIWTVLVTRFFPGASADDPILRFLHEQLILLYFGVVTTSEIGRRSVPASIKYK